MPHKREKIKRKGKFNQMDNMARVFFFSFSTCLFGIRSGSILIREYQNQIQFFSHTNKSIVSMSSVIISWLLTLLSEGIACRRSREISVFHSQEMEFLFFFWTHEKKKPSLALIGRKLLDY